MRLERGCFEGLEYLETLDLGENNMWALESGVFADLASLKTLNLTGNSFQELAELQDAGISDSLQVLDVSSNGLLELSPAGLSSFGSLRELHARANHLAVIHDGALRDLKRLEVLDVSDNRLVALPAMMLNETRLLRDLRVQNNSIRVLPPSLLSDLPQLQAVNMSRNNLSSEWIRKDTFAGLFRLIVLDLSANQLDSLSVDVFHDLSSLQVLDLSRNVLTSVPDGVFSSLSNLHTLSLSDNALARLGRYSLAGLHVLSRLRLDNNRLTDIADLTFSNVTSVEHLLLQRNQLLSVPAALRRLTFLSRLDLADNFIRDVPVGALAPLRQLSFISLAGNQLSNVSVGCLTGLSSLAVLDLSRNRISGVESGAFDAAAGLRVVRIDANRLSNVNGLFAKLPALLWLNASDNQIEFFDYALIPVELRWLDLHNNRIRKIGNFYNIESKIKLETLDLSHNEVSHLAAASVPDGIKYFILASNQLTTVELGTFEAKSRLIRADFSSNQLSELDLQAVTLAGSEDSVAPAELLLAGNPFFCDCAMDWLLTIDTMTPRHKYPQVLDAERVMCRLLRSPGHPIPLPLTKPADFLCNYERHCFALCHCCNYVACDCEMKCPDGCSCYHDHTWNTNIVDCSSREQLAISREIPMDATALLAAGNNIRSLESHTFIGRKRIRLLYVNNSNVEEIQNRSLNGLSALQVLRLENNVLPELYGHEFDSLQSLRELYLHNNRIARIHPATFAKLHALEVLTLHGNQLTSFPVWQLTSPYLVELTLARNPWSCECAFAERLAGYLADNRAKVDDADNIQCEYAAARPTCAGGLTTSAVQRPATDGALVFRFRARLCGGAAPAAAKSSLAGAAAVTVAREAETQFDVFVTYSAQDTRFVNEVLAPELEHATPAYRLCLLRRDAPSTSYLGDAVHHCVQASRRTLLVLSRNFLDNEWCRFDFKSSHLEALRRARGVVAVMHGVERAELESDLRALPACAARDAAALRAVLPSDSPSPTCSTVVSDDRSDGPAHGRSDSSHALVYSAQAPHNNSYSSIQPSEHTYMTIEQYQTAGRPATDADIYCTLEPEVQPQMPSDPDHPGHQHHHQRSLSHSLWV
ncbi:toll-like receptor Tollo [Pollicipes pollicipes]|uniref:toll-like receptor Tollo n=1 Tax=Pollicipes pollicipes TaxID=41117 RepID=UPI0018858043|nr:toll-like receptor Tollo [Pollicipes pollicipes]